MLGEDGKDNDKDWIELAWETKKDENKCWDNVRYSAPFSCVWRGMQVFDFSSVMM